MIKTQIFTVENILRNLQNTKKPSLLSEGFLFFL